MKQHRILTVIYTLLLFIVLSTLSACTSPTPIPTPTPTPPPLSSVLPSMEAGVNVLNSPVPPGNGIKHEATDLGIYRDRWAVQWFWVEQPWRDAQTDPPWGEGNFNFVGDFPDLRDPRGEQLTIPGVSFDIMSIPNETELTPLVTLNGIPRLYDCTYWPQEDYPAYPEATSRCAGTTDRIEGLSLPTTLDNGEINPDNKWARFVFETVNELLVEKGIATYQIGNEPDVQFANGGPIQAPGEQFLDDYVDMVAGAEKAAQAVTPAESDDITLVLGAPSGREGGYEEGGWVNAAWNRIDNDNVVDDLDAIAIHAYGWPFLTWSIAERGKGLIPNKPIWVTESGLPLCIVPENGSPCANTEEQQASYVLQQFAYARVAGISVNYYFRMYDDPRAFGLRRASGQGEREAAKAISLATEYLTKDDLIYLIPNEDMPQSGTRVAFGAFVQDPDHDHTRLVFESRYRDRRVTVLWANVTNERRVTVPRWAEAGSAKLFDQSSDPDDPIQSWQTAPENYEIDLEAALPISSVTAEGVFQQDHDTVLTDYGVPAVGGRTYILIEYAKGNSPTVDAALVCKNGQPAAVDFSIDDGGAGYESLSVVASPEQVFDLSLITQPGRSYYGTIDQVPAIGATATITLTNQAGESVVRTLHNPGASYCTNNPPGPGGDHPDDNYSAASGSIPSGQFLALPEGARSSPRVAILNRGASHNLWQLVLGLGEPAVRVEPDFDPVATAADYPVLLIPSGGLYGMETSISVRSRLEEYARLGGTVVAFDQQHGYEYRVLPGGQVSGYGWAEDNSCFAASLKITQWHPLLAGFEDATLDAQVDGYFTSLPENVQVLLARSVNGKPGLILYPFGEGQVLAMTSFDDWGAGNGQTSPDSRTLLRNLLAWAMDQPDTENALPEYLPDGAVSVSVPVTNSGDTPITSVQMDLVSPERKIITTQSVTTSIGAGETRNVPFTTTAARPLGIWRVDATKYNDVAVAGNPPSAIFAVANPVNPITPNSSLLLSITAPSDSFTPNSMAPFKFHVFNNSDIERTATIHYGLPHHTWESHNSTYGYFSNNSHTLTIPPHSEATYTWEVKVFTTDRLWASLSETVNGQVRTVSTAHFAVYRAYASAGVSATSQPGKWFRNKPVTVKLTVTNTSQAPLEGKLVLRAVDAQNVVMGEPAELTLDLPAGGQDEFPHTFSIPSDAANGTAILSAIIEDTAGNIVGRSYTPFEIPFSPLALKIFRPIRLEGSKPASLEILVTNQSSALAVANGKLKLTLTTPDNSSVSSEIVPFSAPVSPQPQTVPLSLALPALRFGQYTLRAESEDEYSMRYAQVTWSTRPWLQGIWKDPTHHAGKTASLDVKLINPGPFVLPLTATADTEFYTTSSSELLNLQPYSTLTYTFSIPIPATVEVGSYPVTVTLVLPSGDTLTRGVTTLHVPPSELACTFERPTSEPQPGEVLTAAIANEGGVHTSGTYRLELQNADGNLMQSSDGTLSNLDPDAPPQMVPIDIPLGLVAGEYTFICQSEDSQTGDSRTTSWPVQIDGVAASLNVSTDQTVYASDEEIRVTANVDNTGAALPEGQLDLRITHGDDDAWSWEIYRASSSGPSSIVADAVSGVTGSDNASTISGLSSNWIASITVDTAGNVWNVWAGDYDYNQARQINMLSPDSTAWTTYTLPIGTEAGAVSDIAIDGDGRKWMATDEGVARLPANNDEDDWMAYTTTDGLASNYVTSIAIDTAGNAWVGTNAGASKLTKGSSRWDTFTYESTGHGLASDRVYAVEVDSSGNIWFGTHAGLSKLAPDGTWTPYTSGLLSNHVYDIAFDGAGKVWMATPAIYSSEPGGVSVLKMDTGSIKTYVPPTSSGTRGLASKYVTSVEVDTAGRIWIGHEMSGVDVLMPDDPTWIHFNGGETGVLSGYVINDIAASPNGDVWLATQPLYLGANDGGVTRAYDAKPGKQVVWQDVSTVSLESAGNFNKDWPLDAAYDLGATGKFRLEANLTSLTTGQHVADDEWSFYVFPPEVELRLDTSTRLCRPGQPIELTATVKNTGAVLLTERRLVFRQDGNTIFTSTTFGLAPGEEKTFSFTATAPASTGMTNFTAGVSIADFQVTEAVEVGLPMVTHVPDIPEMVDSQSFPLAVVLSNSGRVPATVHAAIETSDEQEPREVDFTVPAGGTYRLTEDYTIRQNTDFTITFSGDFTQTLEHTVILGEALAAEFTPAPVYLEGVVDIPYTLTNTGQLARVFTTSVNIHSATASVDDSITAYLQPGQAFSGTLAANLDAGDYTLTYTTSVGGGTKTFRVVSSESATLEVTAGEVENGQVTLTTQPVNTGPVRVDGVLQVEAPFMSTGKSVSLAMGETKSESLTIDLSQVEAGTRTIVVKLVSSSGSTLATDEVSINVPGPDLRLTHTPEDTPVPAGAPVTLTFDVENKGSAPAMATIDITLGTLLDDTGSVWLPGGASGQIVFNFVAPDGLTGNRLTGEYSFEGVRHDLSLPIAGLDLGVSAEWDHPTYAPGDTATLKVTVTSQAAADAPPLYAHVSYNGETFTRPLVVGTNGFVPVQFPLTAALGADPKVFYAIYETAEQRGVYLNTTYLYMSNPGVTIVPDHTVYHPGDIVHAMVYTSLNATLTVSAPGLEPTPLTLAGQNQPLDFTLPADLLRGTYSIDYSLPDGAVFSVPFDVDAPWVRVTEARLLDMPYAANDDVRADLTIASTAAIGVRLRAWLIFPDGTSGDPIDNPVSLLSIANNPVALDLSLATTQAGPHRLVYQLNDPANADRVYASGSETFDVGMAQVLGVHTDRESYPLDTDPVTATVTLYAEEAGTAHLDLLRDGVVVNSRDIPLVAGTQTETILVPATISPGDHTLVARLQVGALAHSASASFAYGTDVVDLVAGMPQMSGAGGTRTVRVYVYNTGRTASIASSVEIWDGAPGAGGTLINEQDLPALAPGANVPIEITWNILGQAGSNTLTVLVDPEEQVAEYNEDNNSATKEVSIPDFELEIESGASSYDEGQPAIITLHAANLTQTAADLVVTTTAVTGEGQVVFTDTRILTLPAASEDSQAIIWETAQVANATYTLHAISGSTFESNTLSLSIENVAPLVEAGPDQAISLGEMASFDGSFTDPGALDTHTIAWDFDDGTTAEGTRTPTHTYTDTGVYTVTLTVTDSDGGAGSDTLTITVSNVAPVVDAGQDAAIVEGSAFSGAGSFTDTGTETWTATVNYGDGSGIQPLELADQTFDLAHTYADDGVYSVEVCVADNHGGSDCDTLVVTVSNAAPVVDAGPDRTADEGILVLVAGSFTDPGSLDTHTTEWDFGDGSTASGESATHIYADNGVYTVTFTVTDDDGGVGSDTRTVTVSNVAPDVTFSGPGSADADTPVTFHGAFTDPGSADSHTIAWTFGDGGTLTGSLTAAHTFSTPGTYTVTLTVTDDDGGVGTWEASIEVSSPVNRFTVTSTGDGADSNTGDGICRDSTGACTLRAAIQQANATAGIDTIAFNLSGSAPYTIRPLSSLPTITGSVVLDGSTQPGYAGMPLIEINGSQAVGNGLTVTAGGSTVRGLVINRFSGAGIRLSAGGGNTVQGNFIGTDVTGTLDLGNGTGVEINASADNTIGGTIPGVRNVISGNNSMGGIYMFGNAATGNQVQGNFIGTDVTGTLDLGNAPAGVYLSAPNNTIGGVAPGIGNVISGNDNTGIWITLLGSGTYVQRNFIGTDAGGSLAIGNSGYGIHILTAENNRIGGTTAAAGNIIAHNGLGGVMMITFHGSGGKGNTVRANSIFSNTGLGIDLESDGVTPNDTGDADGGANYRQNYPVLNSAASGSGTTTVQGTLNSAANKVFTLDFYASSTCDASGYGEGKTYLGAGQVTTNASGNASFSITLPAAAPAGWVVTATATDPSGNTSEFSSCVTVGPVGMSMAVPALTSTGMSMPEIWYWHDRIRGF